MGWQTDWLYQLIFKEVEHTWKQAIKDGSGKYGPAPDYFVVTQYTNLDIQPCIDIEDTKQIADQKKLVASFKKPILRYWIYNDSGICILDKKDDNKEANTRRGMFYTVGSFDFSISADRKRVLLQYTVGPLYGAQRVYGVRGQGKRGKLEGDPDFVVWIS